MENQNPTSHIVKGAIIASIGILISIIVHVFNLYESQWINWVTYVLIIGGLVYGAILYLSLIHMEENPKMTDELIEQAMTMTRKYFLPFAIGGSIIGTAFIGLIGSLLGAAFAKKNANPFNESEN